MRHVLWWFGVVLCAMLAGVALFELGAGHHDAATFLSMGLTVAAIVVAVGRQRQLDLMQDVIDEHADQLDALRQLVVEHDRKVSDLPDRW